MPNIRTAENIVNAYHRQAHRVADRLITAQTGLWVYETTLKQLAQELPAGDLVATLDLFESLLDSHIPACAVCSNGGF